MKPWFVVFVFMILLSSAVLSSIDRYNYTEQTIINDMNQALEQTLSAKREAWITPDTINDYRRNLKIDALRAESFLSYAQPNAPKALCSKRMKWRGKDREVAFQSYATCSFATVWGMSDQRIPYLLICLSSLWLLVSLKIIRRKKAGMTVFGELVYSQSSAQFYDSHDNPIPLTPLQSELMRLFLSNDQHTVSKKEICDRLWPKKPDASDTLYTLIRRIRPVIEERGKVKIVNERGKEYRLEKMD